MSQNNLKTHPPAGGSKLKTTTQNSKLFFIVSIVVIVVGFVIYGYSKTVPGTEDQTEKRPQIEVTPQSFDFGEVKFGEVVEHVFEVKNIGGGALEIKRVSTSCGCTKAQANKEKLEPNEQAELLVTYDSAAMGRTIIGKRVERFVYIRNNDPENPQAEVTIWATVK